MVDQLQNFVEATDPLLQWLILLLISMIPFVEAYIAAPLGIIAGVNPIVAIIASIVGNVISMVLFVLFGEKIRKIRHKEDIPLTARKQKLKERFDKYGVALVSLLGQTLLPSQITSVAMVTFGAKKNAVIFWQTISIIIWGVAFGLLGLAGLNVIR